MHDNLLTGALQCSICHDGMHVNLLLLGTACKSNNVQGLGARRWLQNKAKK